MMATSESDSRPGGDDSGLNRAGAARRRLLKAVGMGAAASLLSIDWKQPKIRLGALPAHARATGPQCDVELNMTLTPNDQGTWSITVTTNTEPGSGGNSLSSFSWTGSGSQAFQATDSQPASATNYWGIDYGFAAVSGGGVSISNSINCCGDQSSSSFFLKEGVSDRDIFVARTDEDGICDIGLCC